MDGNNFCDYVGRNRSYDRYKFSVLIKVNTILRLLGQIHNWHVQNLFNLLLICLSAPELLLFENNEIHVGSTFK